MIRSWHLLLVALAFIASPAAAQTFPELTGRVVDQADLLSPEQEAQLTQLSEGIEKASSRQFVVATVSDLQDYPIEDYGYRLGRAWGIGQEEANNGVILLVAPNERRVRIEVGYGLEPVVPDGYASGVINQTILPAFRDGDMAGGIIAGANEIAEQLRLPLEAAEQRALAAAQESRNQGGDVNWIALIFWIGVILFILVPIIIGTASGKKYRRGRAPVVIWGPTWTGSSGSGWGGGGSSWGGGGFGGGFSGGGGSFGGGGASGGW